MLEKHSTTQAHFFMIGLLIALTLSFNLFFAHTFFLVFAYGFLHFSFQGFFATLITSFEMFLIAYSCVSKDGLLKKIPCLGCSPQLLWGSLCSQLGQ